MYAYERRDGDARVVVTLNFSAAEATVTLPELDGLDAVALNDIDGLQRDGRALTLKPWQALVFAAE